MDNDKETREKNKRNNGQKNMCVIRMRTMNINKDSNNNDNNNNRVKPVYLDLGTK